MKPKRDLNKPQISVWQFLVKKKNSYILTRGYYRSKKRCEDVLGPTFEVIRPLEFTKHIIDEDQTNKWELER